MAVAVQTTDFNSSQWFRGIVTNVANGQGLVEVKLVDYGRSISAVYTQLKQLPERFRQTTCQVSIDNNERLQKVNVYFI